MVVSSDDSTTRNQMVPNYLETSILDLAGTNSVLNVDGGNTELNDFIQILDQRTQMED